MIQTNFKHMSFNALKEAVINSSSNDEDELLLEYTSRAVKFNSNRMIKSIPSSYLEEDDVIVFIGSNLTMTTFKNKLRNFHNTEEKIMIINSVIHRRCIDLYNKYKKNKETPIDDDFDKKSAVISFSDEFNEKYEKCKYDEKIEKYLEILSTDIDPVYCLLHMANILGYTPTEMIKLFSAKSYIQIKNVADRISGEFVREKSISKYFNGLDVKEKYLNIIIDKFNDIQTTTPVYTSRMLTNRIYATNLKIKNRLKKIQINK